MLNIYRPLPQSFVIAVLQAITMRSFCCIFHDGCWFLWKDFLWSYSLWEMGWGAEMPILLFMLKIFPCLWSIQVAFVCVGLLGFANLHYRGWPTLLVWASGEQQRLLLFKGLILFSEWFAHIDNDIISWVKVCRCAKDLSWGVFWKLNLFTLTMRS